MMARSPLALERSGARRIEDYASPRSTKPISKSVLLVQQGLQPGKGSMGGVARGRRGFVADPSDMIDVASVLVVVAVHAQEFPIAAVRRVVVVVMVAMMDGEFSQILTGEFTRASPANPRIHLERLGAIVLLAEQRLASCLGHDLIQLVATLSACIHGRQFGGRREGNCPSWPGDQNGVDPASLCEFQHTVAR